ncbi:DUF2793 domain-containing protein [Nitratireductor sp. GCM10026969]|uniref:DUF2793 domain-containing protein n=1 Tax=Nitratireductor sp. GCM10026969 TaxID=3252645 RepID=UPI003618C530
MSIDPENTALLKLPYIMPSQAQKHVTHNEAIRLLDGLTQVSVLDRDWTAPPDTPEEGDRYIVAEGASGGWEGWDSNIAYFADGVWIRLVQRTGWLAWVEDEARIVVWDGSAWTDTIGNLTADDLASGVAPMIGVNTAADGQNRFAIKSDAALFSHDDVTPGSGHIRATVNKAGADKDAGFIFQSAWSARALFGLLGNDDFSIKVSPDGAAYHTALVVDRNNGLVKFPGGLWGTGSSAGTLGAQALAFTGGLDGSALGQRISFGSGQTIGDGPCMPFSGKVVAATMGQQSGTAGTYTLEAVKSGGRQGASYRLSHSYGGSGGQHAIADFHSAMLAFAAGDRISFEVVEQPGPAAFTVTFFVVFD